MTRYRPVRIGGCVSAQADSRADGSLVLRASEPLGDYPARLTDRLEQHAATLPRVVSNFGPLPHYAAIDHLYTAIAIDTESAWKGLRTAAANHHAEYVLCHRQEAWRNWEAFLQQPVPADFEVVAASSAFRAYRPRQR